MTIIEGQLKYWQVELRALQDEIEGSSVPTIEQALKDDLRKAVRRVREYQRKVERQKSLASPRQGSFTSP
jgi:hypothetical protein